MGLAGGMLSASQSAMSSIKYFAKLKDMKNLPDNPQETVGNVLFDLNTTKHGVDTKVRINKLVDRALTSQYDYVYRFGVNSERLEILHSLATRYYFNY